LKAANPELPALIRHGALSGCQRGSCEREDFEQSRDEEQRDHGDAEAQPGQGELRQQGDGAFTDAAQVAAHADHAVKGKVHERAAVEAMTGQRLFGLALRAVARAVTVGIGDLFGVLCDGAGEWV